MDFNYKLGIVGSSGAGKTSLIMACYMAFENLLKGSVDIKPNSTATKNMLQRAEEGFKSCIVHKESTWTPPKLKTTTDVENLEFSLSFEALNQNHNINLTVMDYPGHMLGNAEFSKEVTPFLYECNALFLPIPADILMQWYNYKDDASDDAQNRKTLSRLTLNDENACRVVDNWMTEKASNKQPAQLFFVPVRCEKYFTDNTPAASSANNGILGVLYNSVIKPVADLIAPTSENVLLKAVDDVYYQQLHYTSGMAECVSVITTCVDTYGIVEECQMDVEDNALVPQFKHREGMGRIIKIKNAYELLASMFIFQLEKELRDLKETIVDTNDKLEKSKIKFQELKNNRTFWESMWGNTPQMNDVQNEINKLTNQANQYSSNQTIINTLVDMLHKPFVFSKQRTKIYNPEKD